MVHFILLAAVLVATSLPDSLSAAPLSLSVGCRARSAALGVDPSARAGVTSAAEAARAAAQLPDPMLRVGMENLPVTGPDRFSTTREQMTMKRFGISQEWLSGEKRDALRAAAEAAVGKESVQVRIAAGCAPADRARLHRRVLRRETLELTTLMEHHAHQQLETARARVASASGSSEEVLRLGAARGMAEDESAELRQQQSAALVALQRWIGTRADELVEPSGFPMPSEDEYISADPSGRIAAARGRGHAHGGNGDVVEPASELDLGGRLRAANRLFGHGLVRRQHSAAGRAGVAPGSRDRVEAHLVDRAEADLTEAIRAARGEYLALVSDVQRLRERIERVRSGVLVPAQQRTAAATAAYRSNQASLATLFDARHGEVDVQRKLLGVRRELARRQAQLAYRPILTGATP